VVCAFRDVKGLQILVRFFLAAAAAIIAAPAATAQPLALPRADVSATVAWLTVNTESPAPYQSYDDWNTSLFGGVGVGWHWTDHLKTEIDFGAGTKARAHSAQPITIDGRPAYIPTESTLQRRTLGISQQYQFFRNAWFHPHVAVGANVSWERISDHFFPYYVYDGPNRAARLVQPERVAPPRTEVRLRPFVATGFKGYVSRRGFFRTDLRLAFRDGVDDVLLRIGFGIDF
jgi:hypothetical protein